MTSTQLVNWQVVKTVLSLWVNIKDESFCILL